MKIYFLLVITISLVSCNSGTKKEQPTKASEIEELAEGFNTRVPDEEDGGEMLLGKINKEGLLQEPFKVWFKENYEGHPLDSARVELLNPLLNDVSIKVFMGTWCEDSQREVPALFKILEETNFDMSRMELVAVTHEKGTPQGFENDLNIEYVPTIIFYKNGKEMNRFVEYAQESIEKDILKILSSQAYQNPYAE